MAKDLIILLLIGVAGWYGYTHFEGRIKALLGIAPPAATRMLPEQFACDARIYCSQMTSCEEARFFLKHCPRMRVDEYGGASACEKRWCE